MSEMEPMMEWHKQVQTLVRRSSTYPTGMATSEALWRALTADGGPFLKVSSRQGIKSYKAWEQVLQLLVQQHKGGNISQLLNSIQFGLLLCISMLYLFYGQISILRNGLLNLKVVSWFLAWSFTHYMTQIIFDWTCQMLVPDYIPNLKQAQRNMVHLKDVVAQFEFAIGRVSPGRRFCKTETGFFGWVSERAQEGDDIVFFRGCKIPFTVRATKDESVSERLDGNSMEAVTYTLTGDCYMQGLMNGEGYAMDIKEKNILIS
jgi:hypothetical protein